MLVKSTKQQPDDTPKSCEVRVQVTWDNGDEADMFFPSIAPNCAPDLMAAIRSHRIKKDEGEG